MSNMSRIHFLLTQSDAQSVPTLLPCPSLSSHEGEPEDLYDAPDGIEDYLFEPLEPTQTMKGSNYDS